MKSIKRKDENGLDSRLNHPTRQQVGVRGPQRGNDRDVGTVKGLDSHLRGNDRDGASACARTVAGLAPWEGQLLTCNENEDGSLTIAVSVEGEWKVRPKQKVTKARHEEMVNTFNLEARPLLFDYDHSCIFAMDSRAAGWGKNLRIDGDKLLIDFEGTPEGKAAILNKEYQYVSPVYQFYHEDHVTGKKINTWRLHSVALTNTPFITELPKITNTDNELHGGNEMDPELLAKLEQLLGVKGEAAVNAKLKEMETLQANHTQLQAEHKQALELLNTQTVDGAIANKKLLPGHREFALQLINSDRNQYDKFVETVSVNMPALTTETEVKPNAGDAIVQNFGELMGNSEKAKSLYTNNRGLFDQLYAQHVRPAGSEYQVNTAAGFGQKLFIAKVHDLEVEAKKMEREVLDTIHDRSSELKGSEESLEVPRFTPGDVVSMPATSETFVNGSVEDMLSIPLDDEKGYPIIVTDAEQLETNIPLRETRAEGGRIAHKKYRNGYLLGKLADAAASGNRLKYADTTDNVLSDADILNAATILDNAEAPNEGRYMAIGATMHQAIASNPNFLSRDKMGEAGRLLPMNVIGMLRGFEVVKFPDSRMPLLNASTGAVGTTGKKCVLFYQKYALAYGAHAYELKGPQLDVTIPANKYNLYRKQGAKGQNTDFIVTYREND